MSAADAAWVAADWGTSNLRAWVMDGAGEVIAALTSDRGMGSLKPAEFEPVLLDLIAPYFADRTLPVIICGMAGARQGWVEAPYASAPSPPPGAGDAARPEVSDPRIAVHILPGVMQDDPPDVMRGEETQIAGFLRGAPGFEGVLCLPGTHSKWVRIQGGEITGFATFMTGELFALLSGQSVLRHSLGGEGWDDAAFQTAAAEVLDAPERLVAQLFPLRAASLLQGTSAAASRARLSGLLMGAELAAARAHWQGQDIVLVGAPGLTALYRTALQDQGAKVRETDGSGLALAGLTAAYEEMTT
ncbi:2-dehydro-3-deoxygalactonokinase [Cribrihabitans neustonicus]|uniref:2-dehydro-3-deoxygalactonokinase n=1 Tax=Cribrihabitans neustonicus TaxID=1429085 RepID=UPI003B5B4A79